MKTHVAVDPMDICLSEGDIVGVVMEKDPMGNKERWFVDNGGKLECRLVPYFQKVDDV